MCSREDYIVISDGRVIGTRGKFLKPGYRRDGYLAVSICGKSKLVHRLVAEMYVPNTDNKPEVNHKDGNKLNNDYTNLEWATPKENIEHAYATGLNANRGETHYKAVLTCNDVKQIRQRRKAGEAGVSIGKAYGVRKETIYRIANGERWKSCA